LRAWRANRRNEPHGSRRLPHLRWGLLTMQLHDAFIRRSVRTRTWLRTTRRGVSTNEREALQLVQADRAWRTLGATGHLAFMRERVSAVLRATCFAFTRIAGRAASHRGRIVVKDAATLNATHATHIYTPLHTLPQ
jgi:hypothetical protein